MKTIVSIFTFAVFIFTLLPVQGIALIAAPTPFDDVAANHQYAEAIGTLKARGVLQGYDDGTFRPDAPMQRDEFTKTVMAGRGDNEQFRGTDCFPDIKDGWSAPYVCTALQEGVVAGDPDGNFYPTRLINFAEAGKILALAYGQDIDSWSPDWYEPYARALESSQAIPNSVANFEHNVSRGEMAEMMWRLRDEITTKESKGYLNVKYPETTVDFSSSTIEYAETCDDIRAMMSEAGRTHYGIGMPEVMMLEDSATFSEGVAAPMAANRSAVADESFSQTNVQVRGVDEADSVKTNGDTLFKISNQRVVLIDVDAMTIASTIEYANTGVSPTTLYLYDDYLVVLGSKWEEGSGGGWLDGGSFGGGIEPLRRRIAIDYYNPGKQSSVLGLR